MHPSLGPRWWNRLASLLLALVLVAPALAPAQTAAERKVALVIGNAGYRASPLKNPGNDARDMASSLRRAGFEVIERQNATREQMALAVREFGDRLRGAQVGLFYFAGHGLQVRGRNFLVPVDADIAREDEVPYRSLDVNEVLDKMDSARTPVNLVVLDACRNNPFARSFRLSQVGLAQMDAPAGTLIAFATAPGSVAQDGEGRNGLYTGALLRHMLTEGQAVEQIFKRVRIDVARASNNQQVPWESSSLNRDFSFVPVASAGAAAQPGAAAATEAAIELAFWETVKGSTSAPDFQAYLDQYPAGRFAALARLRVAALGGKPAPATQNTPPLAMASGIPTAPAINAPAAGALPRIELRARQVALQGTAQGRIEWQTLGGQALNASVDLATGQPVSAMAASPEDIYFAAVSAGRIHLLDLMARRVVRTIDLQRDGAVSSLNFSADGRWLLLGLRVDGVAQQWVIDVASGAVRLRREAVAGRFDFSGRRIVVETAAGRDETVELP